MQSDFFHLLSTEKINEKSKEIDSLSTMDALHLMAEEEKAVDAAVEAALPSIEKAIASIVAAFRAGGRLIYAGAGTSGRLGVLDASECPPSFGVGENMVLGVIAGGDVALRHAVEGAEDSLEDGMETMKTLALSEKDIVVAISASGYAPWCIGVLKQARICGALCISLVCVQDALLKKHSDICIEAVTGPEVLTGSTRLKAGSATKRVLNMLSTISMIQIGKAYQNLMVDVKASNQKLFDRAIRIVQSVCSVDREKAQALLQAADMHAKTAIVMGKLGVDKEEALGLLKSANGMIRGALEKGKLYKA